MNARKILSACLPLPSVSRKFVNDFNIRRLSTSNAAKSKICVVGSGPAGFYVTQHILKTLQDAQIDIIEKLPVPFGLVRFGVAPDHPEVKNVINTFTKVAENPRVRFIGNLSLGRDVSLNEIRDAYNAVVLCYGAEQDRRMNIDGENGNVVSAREIVAWYNGLPSETDLDDRFTIIEQQLRRSNRISIIGQGNVAIDVARILLSPIETLQTTDITNRALAILSECKINEIQLIGRRGPLQAAFSIKELREMLKLPNVNTVWRPIDFKGIDDKIISSLPRPKKRIIELMLKNVDTDINSKSSSNKFSPIFFRSPKYIKTISNQHQQLCLVKNILNDTENAISTDETEVLETDLILRSIGYKSRNVCQESDLLNFNDAKGLVHNNQGRVLKKLDDSIEHGLYVSGWLGTGPTGVILTTMNNSFFVAKNICQDIQNQVIDCTNKPGLDLLKFKSTIDWNDWLKIDKYEKEIGALNGKPQEKILSISKMLKILK